MSRSCEHFEELISLSFDASLGAQEKEDLELHLTGCASCRDFHQDLVEALAEIESVGKSRAPALDPNILGERVMASLESLPQQGAGDLGAGGQDAGDRSADTQRSARWLGWGAAVTGLVAAAILVVTLLQQSQAPEDPDPDEGPVASVTGLELRRVGNTWRTPAVSTAGPISTLHLQDGSRIELEGGTVLRFAQASKGYRNRMELIRGRLTAHVSKAEGRFVVETASGSVEALGTAFAIGVATQDSGSPNGEGEIEMNPNKPINVIMTLAVLTGSVLVNTSWGQETLVQGEKREITSWALKGRIVDAEGKPIVGARVWAGNNQPYQTAVIVSTAPIAWRTFRVVEAYEEPIGPFTQGPVVTDAQGRFFVRNIASPMDGFLYVQHQDYLPLRKKVGRDSIQKGSDGLLDAETLKLARGLSLSGRVQDADGKPVARAMVAIVRGASEWGGRARPIKFTTSDESGRFVIRGLDKKAKGLVVGAWNAESPAVSMKLGDLSAQKEPLLILAKAKPENRIRARVTHAEDGSPMVGCVVRLQVIGKAGPFDRSTYASARSDNKGRVKFDCVPDGEYVLQAVPADQADLIGRYNPPPWAVSKLCEPGSNLELAVVSAIELPGKVVDADTGNPIGRFEVNAYPDPATFDQEYRGRYGHPNPQRIADGARIGGMFALGKLRPGKWKIRIISNGYKPIEKNVELRLQRNQERLSFRMAKATGEVVARVVDEETGKPISDVLVDAYEWSLFFHGANRQYSKSDAEGRVHSTRLIFDEDLVQKFWISKSGYLKRELVFKKGSLPPADLGKIELVKECVIRGSVLDQDGKPLDRVSIEAQATASRSKGGVRVLTDRQGRFSIKGLPIGHYRIRANGKKFVEVELTKAGTDRLLKPRKL